MQLYDSITYDAVELPNGFLSVDALITRTGVFVYQEIGPDGTIKTVRQLRPPEEVFKPEALETLEGLPLTNSHPSEMLNTENVKEHVIGMTSDRPKKIILPDGYDYVKQRCTFFDNEAIGVIKDKSKQQMSLGYECELDFTPGVYKGEAYDAIQRNHKYNHLSLVDVARGGENCRVQYDSDEIKAISVKKGCFAIQQVDNNHVKKGLKMKVFIHDGDELKVDQATFDALKSMSSEVSELKEKAKLVDGLQAKVDELGAKLKDTTNQDEAFFKAVDSAVKSRLELITKATKVVDAKDLVDLSDRGIMEVAIKKVRPELVLDGKSEDYITARFDICMEDYKPSKNEVDLGKTLLDGETTLEDTYKKYLANRDKLTKKTKEKYGRGK